MEHLSKQDVFAKWEQLWAFKKGSVSGVEKLLKELMKEGRQWGTNMLSARCFQ